MERPAQVRDRAARAAAAAWNYGFGAPGHDSWLAVVDAVAEVLPASQQSRVAELEETRQRQLARIHQLTDALTELTSVYHVRPLSELLEREETVSEDDASKFTAWVNARAALADDGR